MSTEKIVKFRYYDDYRLIEKYLDVKVSDNGYIGSDDYLDDFEKAFTKFQNDSQNIFNKQGINVGVMSTKYKSLQEILTLMYNDEFAIQEHYFEDFRQWVKEDFMINKNNGYVETSLDFNRDSGRFSTHRGNIVTTNKDTLLFLAKVIEEFQYLNQPYSDSLDKDNFKDKYGNKIYLMFKSMFNYELTLETAPVIRELEKMMKSEKGNKKWYLKGGQYE